MRGLERRAVTDANGARWVIVTTPDDAMPVFAISADYPRDPDQGRAPYAAFLRRENLDALAERIGNFASSHERGEGQESPLVDALGRSWLWTRAAQVGLPASLDTPFWAVLDADSGAVVHGRSIDELLEAIHIDTRVERGSARVGAEGDAPAPTGGALAVSGGSAYDEFPGRDLTPPPNLPDFITAAWRSPSSAEAIQRASATYASTGRGPGSTLGALLSTLGINSGDSTEIRQAALAIGLMENVYGLQTPWAVFQKSSAPGAPLAGALRPSYNWGAVVASKPTDDYFRRGDKNAAGAPITQKFYAAKGPDEGLTRFLEVWGRNPDVVKAASTGDALLTAIAMYNHGYFTGTAGSPLERAGAYAKALDGAARAVASVLKEPQVFGLKKQPTAAPSASKGSGGGLALLALGAAVVGGFILLNR